MESTAKLIEYNSTVHKYFSGLHFYKSFFTNHFLLYYILKKLNNDYKKKSVLIFSRDKRCIVRIHKKL